MPLSHSCFLTSLFSLSVFICSPFSFVSLCSLFSSLFFCFFSFLLFFSLVFPYSFLLPLPLFHCCFHYAHLMLFYTTCRDEFYYFTPQLLMQEMQENYYLILFMFASQLYFYVLGPSSLLGY